MSAACRGCGLLCTCPPTEPCGCGEICGECERTEDAEPSEEQATAGALATAAIAQVARPAIVVWAEGRRRWIEKRAADLLAVPEQDRVYARSVLAGDIVRAYEAERQA